MKRVKTILLIFILTILILSTNQIISNATGETFKVDLSTTSQNLEKGQEFQVLVNFSDISTTEGFTLISGKLYYNSSVLEYVDGKEEFIGAEDSGSSSQKIEEFEINEDTSYSTFNIFYLDAKVKNLKLTFKVKESTTATSATIKFEVSEATNVDNENIKGTASPASLQVSINQSTQQQSSEISVKSVSLDKNKITIKENETETLIASVSPTNATNKSVTWSTSNSSVATVKDGIVTGKKAGNAVITVTTKDGAKTATCNVEVQEDEAQEEPQEDQEEDREQQQANINIIDNNKNNTNNENSTTMYKNETKNDTEQRLPQTGVSIVVPVCIIISIIITIIAFIKKQKYREIR